MSDAQAPREGFPVRPYIPPVSFLALSTCSSAAFVMQAGWTRHALEDVVPWGLVGILVLCGALAAFAAPRLRLTRPLAVDAHADVVGRWEMRLRPSSGSHSNDGSLRRAYARAALTFGGLGLIVGCVASVISLVSWQRQARWSQSVVMSSCEVVALGDPKLGERGASSSVEIIWRDGDGRRCRAYMTSGEALEAGSRLRVVGRLQPLDDSDWARSRFMRGEVGDLKVSHLLVPGETMSPSPLCTVRRNALGVVDPSLNFSRALLAGVVCGRVTELSETEAYGSFSRCGLTHLVAVSGGHLAYVSALLGVVLRRSRFKRCARQTVLIAMMVLYVLFTGGSPSAVRSVSMVALASVTMLGGRRAHAPSALALAVTALVSLDPGVVYDLGFQLSALSVLFIIALGPYVTRVLEWARIPTAISEPLSLAIVAQWATLPITLPVFGELSLISPLANLVVGPVMSLLTVVGLGSVLAGSVLSAVCATWLPEETSRAMLDMLLLPSDCLSNASGFLARVFADVPWASVPLACPWWMGPLMYGAALALYLRWGGISPARVLGFASLAATALVVGIARWALFAPPSITVLDVGQGDAILIREGSHVVLVDAGVGASTTEALVRNHVFRLDAVVVTHWDRDHWGGLPELSSRVSVGMLVTAEGASSAPPDEVWGLGLPITEMSEGDVLRLGGFSCRAVWPDAPVSGEENADSLVLAVSYRGDGASLDVLLTGDAERDELARCVGEVGDVDVLKLGHHGSRASIDARLLDLLKPEMAIASAGKGNAYGHPDPTCIDLVESAGARFLCTMDEGDIVIEPERGTTSP